MTRTYPYDAWTLQPSFKPVPVRITESYHSYAGWDKNDKGKSHHIDNLFPTKEAAIDEGWKRLDAQQAKVAKMQDAIYKREAALKKAMKDSPLSDTTSPNKKKEPA